MLSRQSLTAHVRHLERELREAIANNRDLSLELAKAKERELLLVEMVRRAQTSHERDIMNIAVFRRRYRSN